MQKLDAMKAQVVEIKQETRSRSIKTLKKIDQLCEVLKEDEESSEENTASASAELGGQ